MRANPLVMFWRESPAEKSKMSQRITPEWILLSLLNFPFRALLRFLHSKEIPAQRGCEREECTGAPKKQKPSQASPVVATVRRTNSNISENNLVCVSCTKLVGNFKKVTHLSVTDKKNNHHHHPRYYNHPQQGSVFSTVVVFVLFASPPIKLISSVIEGDAKFGTC